MKTSYFLAVVLLVSTMGAPTALAEKGIGAVPVANKGNTHLSNDVAGLVLSADIVTRIQPARHEVGGKVTACTGSRVPCSLVDDIKIRAGQADIFVPRSIVVRLADVNRASLIPQSGDSFQLVLECGDASEAYTAYLIFDRSRVTDLDIFDGEARQMAEHTVYHDLSEAFDR